MLVNAQNGDECCTALSRETQLPRSACVRLNRVYSVVLTNKGMKWEKNSTHTTNPRRPIFGCTGSCYCCIAPNAHANKMVKAHKILPATLRLIIKYHATTTTQRKQHTRIKTSLTGYINRKLNRLQQVKGDFRVGPLP